MTYYGGSLNQSNLFNSDDLMNHSRNQLIRSDIDSPSEFKSKNGYKSDYLDTEISKEIQIVDPTNGQTVDNLPTSVKIPTESGDETDIMNKKLLTDKQKFLGMKKNQFIVLIVVLIIILIVAIVGLAVSAYLFATDPDSSYDWKIFGIVICSVAIVVVIALFTFILVSSKMRHKKYKQALYQELNDTDSQGNPLKTAKLDKMFKHSKPIKPKVQNQVKQVQAVPQVKQQHVLKQMPPPSTGFPGQPVVVAQAPPQQKVTLVQKVVKQFAPKPVVPSPLVIPADQSFRTSPSNIQLVPIKTPGLPTYSQTPRQIMIKK